MAQTTSATWTANAFVKNVYLGKPVTQYVRNVTLLNILTKGSDKIVAQPGGGAKIVFSLHTSRNGNGVAGGVEDSYPVASAQNGVQAEQNLTRAAKTIKITTALMDMAKTDKQAFAAQYSFQFDNSIEDFKEDVSRQLWLDTTGVIGVGASYANNGTNVITITLSTTATHRWTPITRPFSGLTTPTVNIYDSTNVTQRGTGYVSAVSVANGTITVTFDSAATPTLVAGDLIFYGGTCRGNEVLGIESIVGTGTVCTIAPGTYPDYQAAKVETAYQDPTDSFIDQLRVAGAQNGAEYSCAITTWGVQARWGAIQMAKRIFYNTTKLVGGYDGQKNAEEEYSHEGPQVSGIGPMIADNWCPQGTDASTGWFLLLDTRDEGIQQTGVPKWDDAGGQVLRFVDGEGAYQSHWYWFWNMYPQRRNRNVIHKNFNGAAA